MVSVSLITPVTLYYSGAHVSCQCLGFFIDGLVDVSGLRSEPPMPLAAFRGAASSYDNDMRSFVYLIKRSLIFKLNKVSLKASFVPEPPCVQISALQILGSAAWRQTRVTAFKRCWQVRASCKPWCLFQGSMSGLHGECRN